jgi:hypothetical protein
VPTYVLGTFYIIYFGYQGYDIPFSGEAHCRNDRELFSSNRGGPHLNETRRINDLSRGSVLGYEILTIN